MTNQKKSKSQPFPGQYEEAFAEIPEHLVAPIRAIGDSVAAGNLHQTPVNTSSGPKNSPEDLAKLVNHLQETFGAKTTTKSTADEKRNSGKTAPPPSPFNINNTTGAKERSGQKSQYHAYMEEVEDQYWAKKP